MMKNSFICLFCISLVTASLLATDLHARRSRRALAAETVKENKTKESKKSSYKKISALNLAELDERKALYKEYNNSQGILDCLYAKKKLTQDPTMLQEIGLEIADTLFTLDKDKAAASYEDYVKLYPGSLKVAYAHYQLIRCSFERLSDKERDQSKTRAVIKQSEEFLANSALKEYRKEVEAMGLYAQQLLCESEISIVNFYTNRGRFGPAQYRLALLKKEFLPKMPTMEPSVLSAELNLAMAKNDTNLVSMIERELFEKFPAYMQLCMEQRAIKRVATRF